MNLDKYTERMKEAIMEAGHIALGNDNQEITEYHVMRALLDQKDSIIKPVINSLGIQITSFDDFINNKINSLPKVQQNNMQPYLSQVLNKILYKADNLSKSMSDEFISSEHYLATALEFSQDLNEFFAAQGITREKLLQSIRKIRGNARVQDPNAEAKYNALQKYTKDLTQLAAEEKIDPVIGRDEEIRRVMQIIMRRTKNNPVLIGEPGVGKTAIAEGFARRIIRGDVPESLKNKKLLALDLGSLIAGAKFRGEFEERLKIVVNEIEKSAGSIILFIDEIHTLVGAGRTDGAMDAANILKPALARGEMKVIGATTIDEYRKYIEKDAALERRLQPILIDEPNVEETISILRGIKEKYEIHHGIAISDDAIISSAVLSHRYIGDRFLPDKAIDLIDEAASRIKLEMESLPEEIDQLEREIMQKEIEKNGITREKKTKENLEKLEVLKHETANLQEKYSSLKLQWDNERALISDINKQKELIEHLKNDEVEAERKGDLQRAAEIRYGLIPKAEEELFKSEEKVKNLDKESKLLKEEVTTEDIEKIISKWTGIPLKRLQTAEKEKLLNMENKIKEWVKGQDYAITAVSEAIRRNRVDLFDNKGPIGTFLFLGPTGVGKTELAKSIARFLFDDEQMMTRLDMSEYMEKHSVSKLIGAPPGYVGYDESGYLTEAVRRKPYSVILLDEIEKAHPDVFNIMLQVMEDGRLTDSKGRTVDFKNTIIIMTSNIGSDVIQTYASSVDTPEKEQELKNKISLLLKDYYRPEFLNRIDEIIFFKSLEIENIYEIFDLQINLLKIKMKEKNIELKISEKLKKYICSIGYEPSFGARPLKRVIKKEIHNALATAMLQGRVKDNQKVTLDLENDKIKIK